MGGFALVVVLSLIFWEPGRVVGAALILLGAAAMVFGRAVAAGKEAIGERVRLWPGRNSLRPFTVQLWGFGLVILGLLLVLGL